jgi:hypothetical protein
MQSRPAGRVIFGKLSTRILKLPFGRRASVCLVTVTVLSSCTEPIGPRPRTLMRPGSPVSSVVLVDSFYVDLSATPNGTVSMHNYADPIYGEVWATGAINLTTNPVAPGYFGPVNNTNGPVYAGGSFVSGGGCGLNVSVYYPGYGVTVVATPCNDASANWRTTGLFQGAGTATRGGPISEPGATCLPMPCHTQSGSQQVWIRPLPTQLVFTTNSRFITRGSSTRFDVSANPNLMASGGGRPRRVTAWRWRRANPSYTGSDTTTIQWYCSNPAAQTCTLPIYENGTMSVDATVNGVAQTRSIVIVVNGPCPTGDTILDDPVTRAALAAAWAQSNSSSAPASRIERGAYTFDSAGVHIYRLSPIDPVDTPCRNAIIPAVPYPGDPLWGGHTHPFTIGDTLPPVCNPPGSPSNAIYKYWNTYGGPSGGDWFRAWNDQQPLVVADKDSMYRIYPYPIDSTLTPSGTREYSPKAGWQANYLSVPRVSGTCVRM